MWRWPATVVLLSHNGSFSPWTLHSRAPYSERVVGVVARSSPGDECCPPARHSSTIVIIKVHSHRTREGRRRPACCGCLYYLHRVAAAVEENRTRRRRFRGYSPLAPPFSSLLRCRFSSNLNGNINHVSAAY